MISSKKEYKIYLKKDRIQPEFFSLTGRLRTLLFPYSVDYFIFLLRKCEYYKNVKKGFVNNILYYIIKYRFKKISVALGFSIPENVFGPGLSIPHYGTIIVNSKARVGANCRLHACTNIGESGGIAGAPVIGDNVYIGPGAKIYGNITIASNVAIAANAAVNKSFLTEGKIIGGIPAKEIGDINIRQIIKHVEL